MKGTKAMTLRLSSETARELETVARIDGVSVSDAVRRAIDAHIDARREDRAFRDRLEKSIEEHRDILERLSK
jgi:hypothetical protein